MGDPSFGIDNDYGPLRDVLLGKPDFYRWVEAGPLIGRTLANAHRTGVQLRSADRHGATCRDGVRSTRTMASLATISSLTRCSIAIFLHATARR